MHQQLTPTQTKERRAAAKARRRAERARRADEIERAWMEHMYGTARTPQHQADLLARREAYRAERRAERRAAAQARAEWPADLPQPSEGHQYPSLRRIAEWLGVEHRRFDPYEVAKMTSAWATVATERGLIDAPPVRDTKAPEETRRVRMRSTMPGRPEPRPGTHSEPGL